MFTEIVLIAVLILGIGTDIYLALNKKGGDTYSEVLKRWGTGRFPIVAFFLGALLGHFFTEVNYTVPFWITMVVFISWCIIIQVLRAFFVFPKWSAFIIMVFGIINGMFLFPM